MSVILSLSMKPVMDIWNIISGIGAIAAVIAAYVQVREYVERHRPKPATTQKPPTLLDKLTTAFFGPTVGIITALPEEYAAVQVMVENGRDYFIGNQASAKYGLGEMPAARAGKHFVVLPLVGIGNKVTADQAASLLRAFPTVKTIFIVGIASGVPDPSNPQAHVRLGDVVVSNEEGIVQYEFGKQETDGIVPKHSSIRPSEKLLQTARLLMANDTRGIRPWVKLINRAKNIPGAARPEDESDVLHVFRRTRNDQVKSKVIEHPPDSSRKAGEPKVFIGPIASSNSLQTEPVIRDELCRAFGIKAVEMEESGIPDAAWNELPRRKRRGIKSFWEKRIAASREVSDPIWKNQKVDYLVVRGICDYRDPYRNKDWRYYAAMVAAAYTRGLLETISAPTPRIVSIIENLVRRIGCLSLLLMFASILFITLGVYLGPLIQRAIVPPTSTSTPIMATVTPTTTPTHEMPTLVSPTFTTTPSSTPTPTPTHTSTSTPRPTRAPTLTPTLLPPPKLIKPENDSSWAGFVQFEWTWEGNLSEEKWYAVRAWPKQGIRPGHSQTWEKGTSWAASDLGGSGGEYCSHVVVLATWPGNLESCKPYTYESGKNVCYKEISRRSEERCFFFTPPGPDGLGCPPGRCPPD